MSTAAKPERMMVVAQGRGSMSGCLAGVCVLALASLASACDSSFSVENGRPRVAWVAVETVDDSQAALTIWLQDPEGDAVDATITWTVGGESGPLVLAPGSPPLSGLPTQLGLNDDDGQPHRVIWDLAGVPAGAAVFAITVDDRPHAGDDGDTYRTEGLDPRVGGGPVGAAR